MIKVQTIQLNDPLKSMINGVTIHKDKVYMSDSFLPVIYVIHTAAAAAGNPEVTRITLGDTRFHCGVTCILPVDERGDGLAVLDESTILLNHWRHGSVWVVRLNPNGTEVTELQELLLPVINGKKVWADGLLLTGSHSAVIGDNFSSRLVSISFDASYQAANVTCVIGKEAGMNTPTDLIMKKDRLWSAQAHYFDCLPFDPCLDQPYEVVGVKLTDFCIA